MVKNLHIWYVAAVALLAACAPKAYTQRNAAERNARKAQMLYTTALEHLRSGQWETGKNLLLMALQAQPDMTEGWVSLMGAYGEKKMYDSAIIAYDRAWQIDSAAAVDMLLPYAINLAGAGRFSEAHHWARRYAATVPPDSRAGKAAAYRLQSFQFALDFAAKHPATGYTFNPRNLGDSINSTRSEYYPSFTIDDSLLVFTRQMQGIREDFYSSRLQPNGQYSAATPIVGALNEQASKGGIQMSPDGEWLFFAGNFPGQGFGNFDLYMCYATPQGWSTPFNLGSGINTEFWESSPSISPDKQTLYFSSSRPGGYGGKDLYISRRRPDGSWSLAENMGPTINTAADELAPYIHADNQTLYFTSGGHPGYGGSDIYLTRRQAGGSWGTPENLGYPINTIDDDGSLIVAADGSKAYFASFRTDSRGGLDLYTFLLPTYARARTTRWVQGRVYDTQSGKGLPSSLELRNVLTPDRAEKVVTDETGKYLITLPLGATYSLTISRKGYLYHSETFDLEANAADSSFKKDVALQPIAIDVAMELKNILFETNSFTLQPSSYLELNKLVALLTDNPELKVEIGGHTDNVGNAADNQRLSQSRAKAVVDYLIGQGIATGRLQAKGYGSTKPIATNDTEAGRARNRRTEIKITGY